MAIQTYLNHINDHHIDIEAPFVHLTNWDSEWSICCRRIL